MSFLNYLPKIPFLNPSSKSGEYYFALNIGSKKVEGAVWSIEDNKLVIINTARATFEKEEDLSLAANYALDDALADFPFEPTKILFGVPDYWLQDDNLKEEKGKVLKALVKELELTPMAYVSTSHAISHFIQKMQGAPVTAILVNLSNPLSITVCKVGKIIGTKSIKRTESLAEDIEKSLMQFDEIEVLPSKFLLYGNEHSSSSNEESETEKIKEKLLSFPWMENLPFLHLPKVDILEKTIILASISFAGASELNPDVNFSEKSYSDLEKNFSQNALINASEEPKVGEGSSLKKVGFVSGDIEKFEREKVAEKDEDLVNAEDMEEEEKHLIPFSLSSSLKSIQYKLTSFLSFIPLKRSPKLSLLIPVIIVLLVLAGLVFLPKAKVIVYIDPQILEKETQVTVDSSITSVDSENKKIPGKILQTSVSGTEKGLASGKRKIGDPARGTVVIYNKTASPKTFPADTTLVGENNLEFKLDSSVNIASQSGVRGGISFGKATANVSAKQIGPESNFPAGKELTIKGQSSSDFSSEVDSAFSGGTSKEVTVVTAEDQRKLLLQATSNLRAKAKGELQKDLSGDLKVLEEALTEEVTKKTYSKNVNDQAIDFTITVSARYKGTAYSDSDLKTIVAKLVETNVPEGYILNLADSETQAELAKVDKDSKLIFLAKFRAKLMPKLDTEQIKKSIAFKTPGEAADTLRKIQNVISSEIQINPSLPSPLRRLPLLPQNISVSIEAK